SICLKSSCATSNVHWALPLSPCVTTGGFAVRSAVQMPPPSPLILNRETAPISRALSGDFDSASGTWMLNSSCAFSGTFAIVRLLYRLMNDRSVVYDEPLQKSTAAARRLRLLLLFLHWFRHFQLQCLLSLTLGPAFDEHDLG